MGATDEVDKQIKILIAFLLFFFFFLFSWKTGIIPPYHDAQQFVMQQRCKHFHDLQHALRVIRKISDGDELPYQMSMVFLLDEGAFRFVKVPKVKYKGNLSIS